MASCIGQSTGEQQAICHIFTPIGMLGYGFDEQEMHQTLGRLTKDSTPTALIVDSGSTDSGPQKLAMGDMTCPRSSYKRDIDRLLRGVRQYGVPLLIGTAGGAGINQHVDIMTDIVDELSQEHGYSLKLVQIYSEISKDLVSQRLRDGKVSGCGSAVPEMQQADIDECPLIVGQMGPEPYLEAMKKIPDYDVIIGGRAYDPVPYVAFADACLRKINPEYDANEDVASRINGGMYHSSKIMECGGLCATPKSKGAVSTIYTDGSFDIVPTNDMVRCTPLSVASHTLYEKTRPDILPGPGGWLDLHKSMYEQRPDGRTVRVRGSTFHKSVSAVLPYQLKLEAARVRGFRSIYMGSHKDPILIGQIDEQLRRIRDYVGSQVEGLEDATSWDLDWHIQGLENGPTPKSVFLIGECRAKTQDLATAIAATARTATIHASYPGQKATSGNFAFGIGATTEIPLGPCSEFCIYHLMDLQSGEETSLFPIDYRNVDYSNRVSGAVNHAIVARGKKDAKPGGRISIAPQRAAPANTGPDVDDPRTINDVAKILRSKNAGPYEITFDILFDRKDVYEAIKASNLLTAERIGALYDMDPKQIVWSGFFDQALAFKATIPRRRRGLPCASGGYFENDVHGSQMYIPLMALELPQSLRRELKALS